MARRLALALVGNIAFGTESGPGLDGINRRPRVAEAPDISARNPALAVDRRAAVRITTQAAHPGIASPTLVQGRID